MSAYDDAYEAWWFTQEPVTPKKMKLCVDAFLAALPPSIVVDGRVVLAADVAAVLNVDWEEFKAAARRVPSS